VSACPTHGALLGGFVLGSLEPAEMEEMRHHVPGCRYCEPEARALRQLPGLLDTIEPDDVPPPSLSPAVEEAVLDRFARERARRRGPRRGRLRVTLPRVAALAVACAAALALALVWLDGDEDGARAYASAQLAPMNASSNAAASAWADDVPAGTRVRLRAWGLPKRAGGMYELWCVREDGRWVSGGTFRTGRDGRAEAVLTAGVRPGDYHEMVVTRHQGGERGPALLRGRLRY
jgi:anti-sigma-K factor RskA